MSNLQVGFAGLTHLGLNYLAASAEKGFKSIGFDFDKNKIDKLKKFSIDYKEPNLKKTIIKNRKKISFTENLVELKKCNIVFISQDVQTNEKGDSYYYDLRKLVERTSKSLNKKAIMVILSQVQPGFTRNITFDKKRLFYQVETLIFGNALQRALHPERIIVGCDNSENKLNQFFFRYLNKFKCPIIKMKYESAEFAKISINILLASSITTTNMLAQLCEKISADWHEIIPALKLDKRIGQKAYIKPGLGISGGNIERDIYSVYKILNKKNEPTHLIKSFQRNSQYMKSWVYRTLEKEKILNKKKFNNIGILGLAYKENTNSTKNSPTIDLLKKLNKKKIKIYDPKAKLKFKTKNFTQVKNAKILIKDSNVIILMTPWKEFSQIEKELKQNKNKKIIVIDPHRILHIKKNKNIKYLTLGKQN